MGRDFVGVDSLVGDILVINLHDQAGEVGAVNVLQDRQFRTRKSMNVMCVVFVGLEVVDKRGFDNGDLRV
jgi:hypothetical protein